MILARLPFEIGSYSRQAFIRETGSVVGEDAKNDRLSTTNEHHTQGWSVSNTASAVVFQRAARLVMFRHGRHGRFYNTARLLVFISAGGGKQSAAVGCSTMMADV